MAAYAALVSLMNTIHNIHNHSGISTSFQEKQVKSLGEKLDFLLDFIDSYDSHGIKSKEVEDLESQIACAAHAAEDVIESHIVDEILAGTTEECFSYDLQKMIEDLDPVNKKVMMVIKERKLEDQQMNAPIPAASSTIGNNAMMGFGSYLNRLLDWLTGQQCDRQIIPITGMGGIGKTTLARSLYENSLIVHHFDVCAWVTISQEYSVRKILLQALSCLGESSTSTEMGEEKLGERLYKILSGWRYLIILDDIWRIDVWDKIKFFFPNNCTRSRIVVTSRISNIASDFGSLGLALTLLDDDQSWNLFCEKVFGQESCPPNLEKIGRKIVKKCGGLPLSIVVIGGLLKKSSRTQEYWENMTKDLSSVLNSSVEGNHCLNILSLSYNQLTACLKPCFLYLGIFPEDHVIRVSRLIKLWVAEGFIRRNRDQTLEEVAMGYIKDLVGRNLILVRSLSPIGKFKTCEVHDLLRDLCVKIAEKEKFLNVMRSRELQCIPRDVDSERRIAIRGRGSPSGAFHTSKSTSLTRSVINGEGSSPLPLHSKLLRVFHNAGPDLDTILQQVNLRFLSVSQNGLAGEITNCKLPPSISFLWNLQTLDFSNECINVVAPPEIWEMQQLRHIKFMWISLPDPPQSDKQDDDSPVLPHLQTLERVVSFRFSEEACKRMANIKKLHILYGYILDLEESSGESSLSSYCLYNVVCLNKLVSLSYTFGQAPDHDDLLRNLRFPTSLKKLHLEYCRLQWDDLTIIGSLPHLEVLKLCSDSVTGSEWNPVVGEFPRLRVLRIYCCPGLVYWNADESHFPALEKLELLKMMKLDEIPAGIGEIPTLQSISLFNCSCPAAISAIKILEKQESLGNQGLHVDVEYLNEKEADEEFREVLEQEGFTSLNFRLHTY